MVIKYPETVGTKDNTLKLTKAYEFKDVVVPKGYETNGADIPRALWVFVPPFGPKFLPAVVVHDYLCAIKEYEKADDYFEILLLHVEDSFTTRAMVRAVRFYSKYIRR